MFLKIIFALVALKKKLLFNSFKRLDNWVKIVSIILIVYVVVNSIGSSSFLAQFVKSEFKSSSPYLYQVSNIILFLLFTANILVVLLAGSSKFSDVIFTKLFYYPLTIKKVVIFEVLSCTGELFNLIFIPFYFAAYFVFVNTFSL